MHKEIQKLLSQYLEITKIINSAALAKNLDIFENQIAARKSLLEQIIEIDKDSYDKTDFKHVLDEIDNYENKIKVNSEIMKNDIRKNQGENKVKITKMKKSSDVSNKYRHAGANHHISSYIDQKK